ncbi:MAG TPA: cellulase family glycosylhydrolase [Acidimicrobiia bacterium]|nr:cellulase family glycosylhydrolase [Acidimicrobiia bacterium]
MLVIVAVLATATGAIATRPLVANAGQPTAAKPPTFPPDFFGISTGADLTNETPEVFDAEMNIMKAAGADWVRADIPWGLVEHNSASDANWLLIDRIVNMVQAEGMKLEAIIGAPPLWAYDNPPPVADCTTQAEFDVFAYANFAAEVAQRYGSARVPVIELENAPNLPGPHSDWHTANACAYTRLMQASYTAIKNVDPNITVLTGGLGAQNNSRGGISGDAFLAQMYQYGAQGSFDAVSWHPYSYPCFPSMSCKKPRPWYRTDTVRQLMIDNGDSAKLIWSTEYGAPTKGAPDDGHVDQNNQAAMMVNAMQTWMALPYAGPLFVFELRDTGGSTKHKDNWFGMISHDGTKRKLSYYAFQYEAKGHTSVKLPANVIAGTPGP